MKSKQGSNKYIYKRFISEETNVTGNSVLLAKADEAIQRLVSVKARIAAELTRQVAEAPGKTIGAKKRKVLSGRA